MSEKVKWSYRVMEDEEDDPWLSFHEFETFGIFPGEDAAQDYWDNQGGNEASWPVTITVLRNGEEFGKYEVSMDWVPCFSACKRKEAQG